MTVAELDTKLLRMTDEEAAKFCAEFGGGQRTRAAIVRDYVEHPEYERRICQLLGLTTQEERMVTAAVSSARSARSSMIWAIVGVFISFGAMVVSIIALLDF